jgi:hypothetical protein
VAKTERRYARFTFDRPLTEIACSESFWRGFAGGFAPERNLFQRWTCRNLAPSDSIGYSWTSVGRSLSDAWDETVSYGWPGRTATGEDNGSEPGETGFSGPGTADAWRPIPDADADAG